MIMRKKNKKLQISLLLGEIAKIIFMRKKLIIIYIIFLFFAFPVYAGMFLPEIVVNDNLKLCRLYDPNPKEYELPNIDICNRLSNNS